MDYMTLKNMETSSILFQKIPTEDGFLMFSVNPWQLLRERTRGKQEKMRWLSLMNRDIHKMQSLQRLTTPFTSCLFTLLAKGLQ